MLVPVPASRCTDSAVAHFELVAELKALYPSLLQLLVLAVDLHDQPKLCPWRLLRAR